MMHPQEQTVREIQALKKEKNAVILAHFYQEPIIQDLADFVGDSLDLSRRAAATDAEVIAFCGVHFMAETAKILNPDKIVILPDLEAGCSLSEGCPPEEFRKFRNKHPDHYDVSYINCSAAVKAQSDIICTSSNAVKLVNQIPKGREIIFAPDKNLGRWVAQQTGREMVLWDGSCMVHEAFSEEALMELWMQNQDAEVIAHPECEEALLRMADFVGSTSALLKRVQDSKVKKFIVLTEPGIIHKMKQMSPEKEFLQVPNTNGCNCNQCPYMRLSTPEKLLQALRTLSPRIELDASERLLALAPLQRMLALS
jgi:quinolinate synthase